VQSLGNRPQFLFIFDKKGVNLFIIDGGRSGGLSIFQFVKQSPLRFIRISLVPAKMDFGKGMIGMFDGGRFSERIVGIIYSESTGTSMK
jgi:hypothetical protein